LRCQRVDIGIDHGHKGSFEVQTVKKKLARKIHTQRQTFATHQYHRHQYH
jgi:hypothetical protein